MKSPRCRLLAAPAGYDLLTAIEDHSEPGGYYVHAVPVVGFEVEAIEGCPDRVVLAVALDGDTCSSNDKAVRAPDGRVTSMWCDTYVGPGEWLQALQTINEKAERMRLARAIRNLV